ncbi:protein FAR1-RELATED SEQUENCE 5-like [Arachis stenosperma]|uniref:protein FAR1-RELATED SEQUENCE 5-like n=1 Tax=Arachis stenosperma TaxID=217475 RepID=UPI0025AD3A6E|nr:protein FAR1-RELATED SEQUENCE 5-like [Arachis stenosperma]
MENMSYSEEDECYIEEEENKYGNDKTTDGKEEATVLSVNDFLKKQFVSYEEAYECYVRYAKCVGFGVRKGDAAVDSTDKAQVDSMHRHGLPPSKIMGLIAGQAVVMNLLIIEGYGNATLTYLHGKAEDEPIMIVRHSLTDDDKLEHLFWADDLSRFDYQYFGDVLAFDSTYRKNKYNRPLVIFSGTNHHRQTCIFGFDLLADEQTKSYKWLLDNFSEAMMSKHSSLVITDGDNAMKSAIEKVFQNATHRLCAWHLYKNTVSHIKDPEFREEFKKRLYAKFECDEFEEYWHDMVERFNLAGNDWVEKQYRRKEQWATAYLGSKFCAGFRTIQM